MPDTPAEPEILGRVIITWPPTTRTVMCLWVTRIHDADSGADIGIDTTALNVHGNDAGLLVADLARLVDRDGVPVGTAGSKAVDLNEDGEPRTAMFRYYVAEMRTAEMKPTG